MKIQDKLRDKLFQKLWEVGDTPFNIYPTDGLISYTKPLVDDVGVTGRTVFKPLSGLFNGTADYVPLPELVTLIGDFEILWECDLDNTQDQAVLYGASGTASYIRYDTTDWQVKLADTDYHFTTITNYSGECSLVRSGTTLTLTVGDQSEELSCNTNQMYITILGKHVAGFFTKGYLWSIQATDSIGIRFHYEYPTIEDTDAIWFDLSESGLHATASVDDINAHYHVDDTLTFGSDWLNQEGWSAGGVSNIELWDNPTVDTIDEDNYSTFDTESGVGRVVSDGTDVTIEQTILTVDYGYTVVYEEINRVGDFLKIESTVTGTQIDLDDGSESLDITAAATLFKMSRASTACDVTFRLSVQRLYPEEAVIPAASYVWDLDENRLIYSEDLTEADWVAGTGFTKTGATTFTNSGVASSILRQTTETDAVEGDDVTFLVDIKGTGSIHLSITQVGGSTSTSTEYKLTDEFMPYALTTTMGAGITYLRTSFLDSGTASTVEFRNARQLIGDYKNFNGIYTNGGSVAQASFNGVSGPPTFWEDTFSFLLGKELNTRVTNKATAGDTLVDDILPEMITDLEGEFYPIIIASGGGNDLEQAETDPSTAVIAARQSSIDLAVAHSDLVICTNLSLSPFSEEKRGWATTYNTALEAMCDGVKVIYIDLNVALSDNGVPVKEYYTQTDPFSYVHPNSIGHTAIFEYINSQITAPDSIVEYPRYVATTDTIIVPELVGADGTLDILGNPLTYPGRAKYDIELVNNPTTMLDGIGDHIELDEPIVLSGDFELPISFTAIDPSFANIFNSGNTVDVFMAVSTSAFRFYINSTNHQFNIDTTLIDYNITRSGANLTVESVDGAVKQTLACEITDITVAQLGIASGLGNSLEGSIHSATIGNIHFPLEESSGTTVYGYEPDGTAHTGTITASDIGAFWSGEKDGENHNYLYGYELSGSIRIPANPNTGLSVLGQPLTVLPRRLTGQIYQHVECMDIRAVDVDCGDDYFYNSASSYVAFARSLAEWQALDGSDQVFQGPKGETVYTTDQDADAQVKINKILGN